MNKLRIAILFLICASQFRVAAQGTTVGFGSELGQPNVLTATGVTLQNGNMACIGFFDSGFDVMSNAGDLELLRDHWNEYGATTVLTDAGEGGHFYAQPSSSDPMFVGQQIWLWVFKTVDNTLPDANDLDVRQYGLYTSSLSNWRFPPLATPPANRTDIDTSQVNSWAWGSVSGGHLHLAPMAPVPEPAIGGLLAIGLGLFGLLKFRRS